VATVCPACGTRNSDTRSTCKVCHEPLSKEAVPQRHCLHCGRMCPSDSEVCPNCGNRAFRTGEELDAGALCVQSIDEYAQLVSAGDMEGAEAAIETAITRLRTDETEVPPAMHIALGRAKAALGDEEAALASFHSAVNSAASLDVVDPVYRLERGKYYFSRGKFLEARDDIILAARMSGPESEAAQIAVRFRQALEQNRSAAEGHARSTREHLLKVRGLAHRVLQLERQAPGQTESWQASDGSRWEVRPETPQDMRLALRAAIEEAEAQATRAIGLHPELPEALVTMAWVRQAGGDPRGATEQIVRFLSVFAEPMFDGDPSAFFQRVHLALRTVLTADAGEQQAQGRAHPLVWRAAERLESCGRNDLAYLALRAGNALWPSDPGVAYECARLGATVGRVAEAIQRYRTLARSADESVRAAAEHSLSGLEALDPAPRDAAVAPPEWSMKLEMVVEILEQHVKAGAAIEAWCAFSVFLWESDSTPCRTRFARYRGLQGLLDELVDAQSHKSACLANVARARDAALATGDPEAKAAACELAECYARQCPRDHDLRLAFADTLAEAGHLQAARVQYDAALELRANEEATSRREMVSRRLRAIQQAEAASQLIQRLRGES